MGFVIGFICGIVGQLVYPNNLLKAVLLSLVLVLSASILTVGLK